METAARSVMRTHTAFLISWAAVCLLSCGGKSSGGDAGLDETSDPAGDTTADEAGSDTDDPLPEVDMETFDGEEDAPGDPVPELEDLEVVEEDAAWEEDGWEYERGSLASCLLNPDCGRVGIASHMGAWTAAIPGNSMAAYRRAWELGADGIEADVRVSADGVPFMIHNDEITFYESLMCAGRVVSESPASEIDGCLLLPSLTETIPTFEEFVTWARGRILIHLDVKDTENIQVMVEQILAHGAEDFVFIAVSTGEARTVVPSIPNQESVYFLLRVGSVADIDAALGELSRPNIFMLEGDRTWDDPPVDEAAMTVQVARVHDAGLRIMASSDQYAATVANHLELFAMGFDFILSYNTENGVEAARQENVARGYLP
jgi:glycerophosphoryl diester phosphodiesterase